MADLGEQTITDRRTGAVRLRSARTVALVGFLAAPRRVSADPAHADSAGAVMPAADAPAGRPGAGSAQLVGRSRELSLLRGVWRAAAAGRPSMVLVRVAPASGRAASWPRLPRWLQGAIVASTQCFATSGRLALAPVADWLRNPAVRSAAPAGGFPLYVIEAVRSSDDLSAGMPVGDLTTVLRNRLGQVSAAAREVVGLAAAVGTDFTLDLLTEASDLDADTVVGAIDELWRRRIMREFRDGYDFSHDLLRETAYTQVSPPKRWLLHRRVAQRLELLHADHTDLVANWRSNTPVGGRPGRAVAWYRRAADVAAGLFAHSEAIRLHRKALSVVRSLHEGRDRDSQELAILEGVAAPLNARSGYSSPELQQTLERTTELAESLGRKDSTLTGLVALWTSQFVHGRTADSYQTATRAMTLGAERSRAFRRRRVGGEPGHARTSRAEPRARRHARQGRSVAEHRLAARRAQQGMGRACLLAAWARRRCPVQLRGRIRLGREIEHPYSLAVALAYGAITHQMRRDMAELGDTVGELRELCDRYEFAYYREWGLVLDGWSRADESGCHRPLHLGGRRSRDRRVRHGHSLRLSRVHWRGRPDARRRHRVPHAALRAHRRQPDRR